MNKVLKEYSDLAKNGSRHIAFCWVPGHVGITGNEMADNAARATKQQLLFGSQQLISSAICHIALSRWRPRPLNTISGFALLISLPSEDQSL